jgi:double-strand break repair protein MRE11
MNTNQKRGWVPKFKKSSFSFFPTKIISQQNIQRRRVLKMPEREEEEDNDDDDIRGRGQKREQQRGGKNNKNKNDPNLFRILIATDNHLGAHERDPIRKNDSFIAFREILETAKKEKVDALFLGGDLFDQNKPSRETLVQTMDVLREYVFGDDAIEFEVVSDQSINFPNRGIVNFEDENVNVALPIFAIHGNHDDPSGQENLSALDILSSCSLINYFGKHALSGSNTGAIELKPVLLRKGETKLALYGLGWIRDQRLHQMMASKGNVKWIRPGSSDEKTPLANWFNLMLIHQNRVSHAPKNSISERHLPNWMDLVVWGHEHECLIEPQLFDGVSVSQPGSSVTTSLVEAESGTKKICILELKPGKEKKDPPHWRLLPVPLQTTRPYAFKNVSLAEQEDLLNEEEDGGGQDQEAIENFLMITVNGMIKEAMQNAASGVKKLAQLNQLPLIRLRVDLTGGFQSVNVQKFGQKFVGKVANPSDMLLFHKSKKKKGGNKDEEDEFNEGMMKENINVEDEDEDLDDARAGPRQDQKRIERLIKERMDKGLQILDIPNLMNSLDDMVNRDDNKAVKTLCESTMKHFQRELASTAQPSELIEASEVQRRVQELTKKHTQQQQQQQQQQDGGARAKAKKGQQAATQQTQRAQQVREFQDAAPAKKSEATRQLDEEEALERVLLAQQKEAAQDGRAQRPVPASRRGGAKQPPQPVPETKKKGDDDDYVVSDSEEEDDDVIPASAQPVAAARRGLAVGAKSAAAAAAAAKRKQRQQSDSESSQDEEVPDSEEEEDEDFADAKPAPKKRGGAAAAAAAATRATRRGRGATPSTQTKSRKVPESIVIDDSSDSDEKATPSVAAGAGRTSAAASRGRGRARGAKVLNNPTTKSAVGNKRGRGAASSKRGAGNNADDSDSEERARPTRRTRGAPSTLPTTGGTQRSTQRSGAPGGTQRTTGTAWGRSKK